MHITMVKKIGADGAPCRKCAEVEQRLRDAGLLDRIDRVIIADERDPESEGMQVASRYGVDRAPFFVVEDDGGPARLYTVYYRFLKEVLGEGAPEADEARELLEQNPGLDYL